MSQVQRALALSSIPRSRDPHAVLALSAETHRAVETGRDHYGRARTCQSGYVAMAVTKLAGKIPITWSVAEATFDEVRPCLGRIHRKRPVIVRAEGHQVRCLSLVDGITFLVSEPAGS